MNDNEKLIRRAQIIKGQMDGLVKMMDKKELSCLDVFIQIKAAKQGLDHLGKELLKLRLKECLMESKKENLKEVEELIKALS